MTREFIYIESFLRNWANMGLSDNDLISLENALLLDPHAGDVIEGSGGARKLRIQLGGHGKRGGARVIYVDVFKAEKTYLLTAYPKNRQTDLSPEQKRSLSKMIELIKKGAIKCRISPLRQR